MPTPVAIARLKGAKQRVAQAQQEHMAFIERPDRARSPKEAAEIETLRQLVADAIQEYWAAFEACSQEDLAGR